MKFSLMSMEKQTVFFLEIRSCHSQKGWPKLSSKSNGATILDQSIPKVSNKEISPLLKFKKRKSRSPQSGKCEKWQKIKLTLLSILFATSVFYHKTSLLTHLTLSTKCTVLELITHQRSKDSTGLPYGISMLPLLLWWSLLYLSKVRYYTCLVNRLGGTKSSFSTRRHPAFSCKYTYTWFCMHRASRLSGLAGRLTTVIRLWNQIYSDWSQIQDYTDYFASSHVTS